MKKHIVYLNDAHAMVPLEKATLIVETHYDDQGVVAKEIWSKVTKSHAAPKTKKKTTRKAKRKPDQTRQARAKSNPRAKTTR